MLSDSLVESFRARLAPLGLDLADLKIGGTSHRPLVQVRIEWDAPSQRVTVDDCATASRAAAADRRPCRFRAAACIGPTLSRPASERSLAHSNTTA